VTRQVLSVHCSIQQQTRWCWCACCEMILDFLSASRTQCDIANYGLGMTVCCGGSPPRACNGTIWTIHPTQTDISDVYGNFGLTAKHSGSRATFRAVRGEIDPPKDSPVEVCFAWSGGGAHVAVVCGYQMSPSHGHYAYVNDPDPACLSGWVRFSSLTSAYGCGSWTETFTF
jgi:hypothetical protein